jgi:Tfp pilus assembly protein PilV
MLSLTAVMLAIVAVLLGGVLLLAYAMCAMSSRQEREAERQQWLAWCARHDDPERER